MALCFLSCRVTAAVLSGGGLLPVAMVIKDLPSRGNAPLLHRCVFPGNWLQWQRHLSLLGSRAAFEYPMGDSNVLTLPDVIGDYRIRVFIFSLKGYHGILKYISSLMWKNIHSWSSVFLLLSRDAFPSPVPMSEHKYHTGLS